jgi:nucleoid-associated protein EbfC
MPGVDINYFIRQANKLTAEIEKKKAELAEESITGSAADLVTVTASGNAEAIKSIKIDKKALEGGDVAMLEDLLVAAVNQAITNAIAHRKTVLEKISNGVKIPGITG